MNEIIKINDVSSPNLSESYLPLVNADGEVSFPPEFWIETSTAKQRSLIALCKQYRVDYIIFEMTGIEPSVSMAVCRYSSKYNESFSIVQKICKQIGIDKIIVSHGGISTIDSNDSNGELINFICFD